MRFRTFFKLVRKPILESLGLNSFLKLSPKYNSLPALRVSHGKIIVSPGKTSIVASFEIRRTGPVFVFSLLGAESAGVSSS